MTLPELPPPNALRDPTTGAGLYYTEAQMLAYRNAVVEACAKVCDAKSLPMEKATWCIARNCADAIRSLLK